MNKRLVPDYYAKSIFDIPISFYIKKGYKIIFSDLDNTLDSYKILYPSQRVFELKQLLAKEGIQLIIISNNTKKRIHDYANSLNVKYLEGANKPFAKKINGFIKNNSFNKNEIIMVGDQIYTDVSASKRLKLNIVLTEPIVKEDQPITRFNRIRDKIYRKRLNKHEILKNLEVKSNE